jgi:hypothetical protein
MQRFSINSANLFNFPRISQISDSYCGPATIQMLLANIGIKVRQKDIVAAAGVANVISEYGMRVDQMGKAVRNLSDQAQFYYKNKASINDIDTILTGYGYPVGVEWQGDFGVHESEDEAMDDGHYSIVIDVDMTLNQITLVDPYRDYLKADRIFSIREFTDRWWDTNEIKDTHTGKMKLLKDYHMIFGIIPKNIALSKVSGLITIT